MQGLNVVTASITATPDGRVDRKAAATFLGIAPRTLANWRSQGRGPVIVKLGGRVFYRISDLTAFLSGQDRSA